VDDAGKEDWMTRYVYGYRISDVDGEVFFSFRKFPEIITSMPAQDFEVMDNEEVSGYLLNALTVALQSDIVLRKEIPEGDDPALAKADGFISLPVHQSMKLELYKVYINNCRSVADFARQLNKTETLARRLLDLRHRSFSTEIESAMRFFGKELVHDWRIEVASLCNSIRPSHHPSHVHPAAQPR
jgi:hypothetical protein